jgi:hypothetical protein
MECKKLIEAGVHVKVGKMKGSSYELTTALLFIIKKRPYIIFKWAESQDGFIVYIKKGKTNLFDHPINTETTVHKMA